VVREPLLPLELLPLLLGELDDPWLPWLPDPCTPLLLFVFRLEPGLEGLELEPDGSLMLLPRELDPDVPAEPEDPAAPLRDEPALPESVSLPLQPTNNAAALAIANSFFIMILVNLPPANRFISVALAQWVKCCIRCDRFPAIRPPCMVVLNRRKISQPSTNLRQNSRA
jgi:hypothetical protein